MWVPGAGADTTRRHRLPGNPPPAAGHLGWVSTCHRTWSIPCCMQAHAAAAQRLCARRRWGGGMKTGPGQCRESATRCRTLFGRGVVTTQCMARVASSSSYLRLHVYVPWPCSNMWLLLEISDSYTLGMLLHGAPGTGKKSIIKALSHDMRRHVDTSYDCPAAARAVLLPADPRVCCP